ncbi:MAG: helix-turn-helix transcriptional regulator [Bacteroidales bacterium]|nr:helix-turn-helix transcriptional regulator [Bacteroidales bacterium]
MTAAEKEFFDRLVQLVDENIANYELSSEILSERFCITARHFNRKVRAITEMDTTHFIRKRRMALACNLLTQTALPISEIYIRCGLDSANYFSRVFKMEMGQSPTSYRKTNSQL